MQTNNIIKKNKNIFNSRISKYTENRFQKEKYLEFDFNDCLKSDNFGDLKFTNYVKSNQTKKYKKLLDICIELEKDINILDKKFQAREIEHNVNKIKLERLYKIISRVSNEVIGNTTEILKYKNKEDPEIQLFIKKENQILKLYLVDLYHLYMEVPNFKTGRADLGGIYKAHKDMQYCISTISEKIYS